MTCDRGARVLLYHRAWCLRIPRRRRLRASGFLISSLLLQEIERTSAKSFGQFYLRRARRLLPALPPAGLSSVLVLLFARDAAAQFRQDASPRCCT